MPHARSRLAGALLAGLLAAAGTAARAGTAGVGQALPRPPVPGGNIDYKMTVSAGLAGYCRVGWLPVHVAIDASRDFDGELVAVLRASAQGPVLYETRHPVQLPAGSKKDYHLYLRHESPHVGNHGVEVFLRKGRRPVEGTGQFCPLNLVKQSDYLVCVVSDQSRILRGLVGSGLNATVAGRPLEEGVSREFFVAAPGLRQLPDRAAGYNGVDFLVLYQTPLDSAQLGPERLAAILDFARDGGVVVLAASDRDWFSRPELRPLVDVRRAWPASAAEASTLTTQLARRYGQFGPRLQTMPVHNFDIRGCAPHSDWGFWTGRCGLGTVLVWRLDPFSGTVMGWTGLYNNWAEMGKRLHGWRPQQDYGMGFGPSEDNNPVNKARSRVAALNLSREKGVPVILVIFLVVLYLVLVGPINYFVLRRLDMRALSIATIPLLATVFVLLTFALGYIARGVTTVGRRLSVAVAYSGSSRAECVTSQSVFPAGSMLVDIGTDGRGLACPLNEKVLGGQQEPAFATQGDTGYHLERHPLSMWRMAHFEAISSLRLGGAVTLESLPTGPGGEERFQLQNRSAVDLENVFVYLPPPGNRYAWVGDLPKNMRQPYRGGMAAWQYSGTSVVGGRAPALPIETALALWFRGELSATRTVQSRGSREFPYADQARDVLLNDPRLVATSLRGDYSRIRRTQSAAPPMLYMFAMAKEEFEPLRLEGRQVRARDGEARDVLVVVAELGAAR